MSFNIGDRVIPIDVDDIRIFGEGTIAGCYYGSRPSNDIIGYYINFDIDSGPTYNFSIATFMYPNIYMMYTDRFELIGQETSRPPLPEDPRLKGICLKIRELDKKFKRKQEAKAKSIADALAVGATLEMSTTPISTRTVIHRDGSLSTSPIGTIGTLASSYFTVTSTNTNSGFFNNEASTNSF